MSSVGFIRPLYSRHRCIDGSMERKFLAEGDTTDLRSRLFDPRSRAIVSFPLRFHGTSLLSSSFSVSRAHVYTNPEETPGDPILFRDRVGKRAWQTVSGKTLNARVSSNSRDTFSKPKRDEREKERERVCVNTWIVDIGVVQIFKRRMFNSARYLVPHPWSIVADRPERRDVLTEVKCDFKEDRRWIIARSISYRETKRYLFFTLKKETMFIQTSRYFEK